MVPTIFIYLIGGLIAFIIVSMALINTFKLVPSEGEVSRSTSKVWSGLGYDPLSSGTKMYTLPAGVKSS
jgi:hypothetical protein